VLMAPRHGDAALMILRRYCNGSRVGWGRGPSWSRHRIEIAHVEPASQRLKAYFAFGLWRSRAR
jgi:hypothetical protein